MVTDAILAMGFKDGRYKFGQQTIDVRGDKAYVADTQVNIKAFSLFYKIRKIRSENPLDMTNTAIKRDFEHLANIDSFRL